ncbi:MAG: hypothetical protein QM770_20570 [Tepidisphaeraceae bacterium]
MTPLPLLAFGPYDWAVLGLYFIVMFAIGIYHYRQDEGAEEYFLAKRKIPTWALAISIVGASLSAATYVGAPDVSYGGNLTYLILNIGGFLGVFIVGFLFVPTLYRAGTVTIYGFLDQRFGESARVAVACTFLFGRFLASGVRLFFAAIPLVLLMWNMKGGEPTDHTFRLVLAVVLVGVIGTIYTMLGGIKAVIWTDIAQFAIMIGAVLLSIYLLLTKIPLPITEIIHVLGTPAPETGHSKLQLVDLSTDPARPFTLWAAMFGSVFMAVASMGVDQDMAQRFLIAKTPTRGALSVIASQFISIATVSLFMIIGLLLYIYYSRPDIMGAAAPAYTPGKNSATYPQFLLWELPPILSGLAIVGLFAVAQGSMDSAINAMASSLIADVYYPLRKAMGKPVDSKTDAKAPKLAVLAIGVVMSLFAIGCVFIYDPKSKTFLDFALGVMTFAFSGMLAVFVTGLFTKRGNTVSVIAALVTGATVIALLQDGTLAWWSTKLLHAPTPWKLAWPWWMPIASSISFAVCCLGSPTRRPVAREIPVASVVSSGSGT